MDTLAIVGASYCAGSAAICLTSLGIELRRRPQGFVDLDPGLCLALATGLSPIVVWIVLGHAIGGLFPSPAGLSPDQASEPRQHVQQASTRAEDAAGTGDNA